MWHHCGDWPNDIYDAVQLLEIGCSIALADPDDWPGEWECSSPHPIQDGEYPRNLTEYADTPELAICKWFIAKNSLEK
jgi:hypothetical protein